MVKQTVINARLAQALALARHKDAIVLCDGNMPIPEGCNVVDVSLVRVIAARVGIAEIVQRGDQLILYSDIVGPKQLGEVMEKFPHRVLYNALGRPYFSLRVQKGESPLVLLRDVVPLLPGAQNQPQTKP